MNQSIIVFPDAFSFSGYDFPSAVQDKPGGFMRRTYVRDCFIIQVSPVASSAMPEDDRAIMAPWLDHDHRIARFERAILRAKQLCASVSTRGSWTLSVPAMIADMSGTVMQGGLAFPVVVSELVVGRPLEDSRWSPVCEPPVPDTEDLLQKAVDFLALLHNQLGQDGGDSDHSLRAHYRRRLGLAGRILQSQPFVDTLGPSAIAMIQGIFRYVTEGLEKAIFPKEKLAPIHGDYRESNLLIDAQNRRCWIIDFDQGLALGDWANDLWKCGLLQYEAGRMSGMLDRELFARLRERYLSRSTRDTTRSFLCGGEEAIGLRVELLLFDISFSLLLFRRHLGWNFTTGKIDGRLVRGTGFILQLFQKQHDRIVQR